MIHTEIVSSFVRINFGKHNWNENSSNVERIEVSDSNAFGKEFGKSLSEEGAVESINFDVVGKDPIILTNTSRIVTAKFDKFPMDIDGFADHSLDIFREEFNVRDLVAIDTVQPSHPRRFFGLKNGIENLEAFVSFIRV